MNLYKIVFESLSELDSACFLSYCHTLSYSVVLCRLPTGRCFVPRHSERNPVIYSAYLDCGVLLISARRRITGLQLGDDQWRMATRGLLATGKRWRRIPRRRVGVNGNKRGCWPRDPCGVQRENVVSLVKQSSVGIGAINRIEEKTNHNAQVCITRLVLVTDCPWFLVGRRTGRNWSA